MENWVQKLSAITLQKGIHTKTNQPIYFLKDPATRNIKDQLGRRGVGMAYWQGMWWMYASRMTDQRINQLQQLGIDTSVYGATATPAETPETPVAEPEAQPQALTDQSWDDADRKSNWYGFPIKPNIYKGQINVVANGKPYALDVRLDRSAVKGRRKIPSYKARLTLNDEPIGAIGFPPTDKQPWGSYSENDIVNIIQEKVQAQMDKREGSRLYKSLIYVDQVSQRSPELTEFLANAGTAGDKTKINKQIHIDDPQYGGDYPVSIYTYTGETWYAETAVDHQLAPHPRNLATLYVPPTLKTVEEFHQWLDQEMADPENLQKAQKEYIDYLKSFPFLESQQHESEAQFNEVIPIIEGKVQSVEYFKPKLIEKGYLRPHKRQKGGPGMRPVEDVKYILDGNKIKDDIYGDRFLKNTPDFFYATIAYIIFRYKAGNVGPMPIIMTDSMRKFHETLTAHGFQMHWRELYNYLEETGKKLLFDLFEVSARDPFEQWYEFVSGFSSSQGNPFENPSDFSGGAMAVMNAWATFAESMGIDKELALTSPKAAYRQLALKLHPDTNPNDPQAHEKFLKLQEIWNAIPAEKKASSNWLQKASFQKYASVTIMVEGTERIAQPKTIYNLSTDLQEWAEERVPRTYFQDHPETIAMDGLDSTSMTGTINWYYKDPQETDMIPVYIDQWIQEEMLPLGFQVDYHGPEVSNAWNDFLVYRINVKNNPTSEYLEVPDMNISNDGFYALAGLLNIPFDHTGSISIDDLDSRIKAAANRPMGEFTTDPSQVGNVYDAGLSEEKLQEYLQRLQEIVNFGKQNGFTTIRWF